MPASSKTKAGPKKSKAAVKRTAATRRQTPSKGPAKRTTVLLTYLFTALSIVFAVLAYVQYR